MNQLIEFFQKLFDSSDWPPRWHCGRWSSFHGWLYIISDLMIWSAYFAIPLVIIRYLSKKQDLRFKKLYLLFAAFILSCGATHFLDAVAFWIPAYRLNALVRFITGVISWVTVFFTIKYLPGLVLAKPQKALEAEIDRRIRSEEKFRSLLEAAPDSIVIANEMGQITLINQQTEALFGYNRDELLGKPVESLIPNSFHESHRGHREQYFADPKVRTMGIGLELYAVRKDGSRFPVEISLSPLHTEEGILVSASIRDITERKKAEEKIKESEQAFSSLFYKSPIMKIISDAATGEYLQVNDSFADFIEYPKEVIIGKKSSEFNMLLEPTQADSIRRKLEQNGFVRSAETKVISRSGKIRWISNDIDRITLYGKECLLVAAVDITERKLIEEKLMNLSEQLEQKVEQRTEELARSESQFRHTLDNMLEGAQIIGFDWRYLYVNESLARHAKYRKEELLGHTVMEKFPGIETTETFKIYKRCFDERVPIHLENEFAFPDGSIGWFELSFQPVPEGIFILSVDITDRKRAEAELSRSERLYKMIASSIPGSVICLLDTEFRYLLIEGDLVEKIGYSKEQLLGRKISEVLRPDLFEEVRSDLEHALAGEMLVFEAARGDLDVLSKFIPLKDDKDKIYAILTVTIDITQLKKAQRDIIELNRNLEEKVISRTEQLKKVNEELEAFSYSVSHDLRAPLRAIIGFTTILEEDYTSKLDNEAKRITDVIKHNTLKMGHLIDDLLAFSRLGRQELVKSPINTLDLVKEIVGTFVAQTERHNIDWHIGVLFPVKADLNTIRQVWLNLISNAIKYSANGTKPKIEIGSFWQDNNTMFFVKDNGVGFDEKYRDKLFKVFQRLHSPDEFEGTGVGLAIVEKIISKHGGQVWAEGAPDSGAVFWFSLPDE